MMERIEGYTVRECRDKVNELVEWINKFEPEYVDSLFTKKEDDVIRDIYKIFGRLYPLADYLRDLYENQWELKRKIKQLEGKPLKLSFLKKETKKK